jgi:hypothetical protein
MAVLVTAIHVFLTTVALAASQGVDGRNKSGHDEHYLMRSSMLT